MSRPDRAVPPGAAALPAEADGVELVAAGELAAGESQTVLGTRWEDLRDGLSTGDEAMGSRWPRPKWFSRLWPVMVLKSRRRTARGLAPGGSRLSGGPASAGWGPQFQPDPGRMHPGKPKAKQTPRATVAVPSGQVTVKVTV